MSGIDFDNAVAPGNEWLQGVCAVGSPTNAASGVILKTYNETPGRWFFASIAHKYDDRNRRRAGQWAPRDVFPGFNHGEKTTRLKMVRGEIHERYKFGSSRFDVYAAELHGEWDRRTEFSLPEASTRRPKVGSVLGYPVTEKADDPSTPDKAAVVRMMTFPARVIETTPVLVVDRDSEVGYSGGPFVFLESGKLYAGGLVSREGEKGRGELCSFFNSEVRLWLKRKGAEWGFRL